MKYYSQRDANVGVFTYDSEFESRYNVLCKLHREFASANIRWALACSANLFFQGIVDNFNVDEIEYLNIIGMKIPLAPAESQYLLYAMMTGWQPQRKFKRDLLAEYLKAGNLRHPELLINSLKDSIPWWIKDDIRKIISEE